MTPAQQRFMRVAVLVALVAALGHVARRTVPG